MSTLLIPLAGLFASYLIKILLSHLKSFNKDHPNISELLGITDEYTWLPSSANGMQGPSMTTPNHVLLTSGVLKAGFITAQALSIVMLFQYSREIFQEGFPIVHTTICVGLEVFACLVLILLCCCKKIKWREAFMTLDFILLTYFLPYMVIAFIDNPLQATFVYVLLVIGVVIIFVYFRSLSYAIKLLFPDGFVQTVKECLLCDNISQLTGKECFLAFLIPYSNSLIIYYIYTVLSLLNLGGLDNFGELERRLSWPIAVGVVLAIGGYFLKPKKPSDNGT